MSIGALSPQSMRKRGLAPDVILPGATLLLGVSVAYLIAKDQWQIAVLLIALLPGIIILHRYPFAAVLAWLVLMPFLLQAPTAEERQLYWLVHRTLPPLTVAIMLVSAMLRINRRSLPHLGVPEIAMAGYVVVTLFSIYFQNADPVATSILFYDRVIAPMCLYVIVRLSAFDEREMRWLVVAAFLISVSQFAIGILSWVAPELLPSTWLGKAGSRTTGSLVNASVYATTLTFCGLLLLHRASNSRLGITSVVYKLTFLLSVYSIFISFSRASWLAEILVILGLVYIYPKFMVRVILIGSVAFVLLGGLLLADQLDRAGERLYSEQSTESALGRLPVYLAAIRMFEAEPAFGWGYDNFNLYDRPFQGTVLGIASPDQKNLSCHNAYLTLLAEQGLIGFLLFLTPLFWWLVRSAKAVPRMPDEGLWGRKLLIILWLIILGHFVANNFQPVLVVFDLGTWWLTLGLIGRLVDSKSEHVRDS